MYYIFKKIQRIRVWEQELFIKYWNKINTGAFIKKNQE